MLTMEIAIGKKRSSWKGVMSKKRLSLLMESSRVKYISRMSWKGKGLSCKVRKLVTKALLFVSMGKITEKKKDKI